MLCNLMTNQYLEYLKNLQSGYNSSLMKKFIVLHKPLVFTLDKNLLINISNWEGKIAALANKTKMRGKDYQNVICLL